jgi:hypothetical protein
VIEIERDVLLTVVGVLAGIVSGYILGLRTNYIIGRVFEYRAFLLQALFEVRLMSGRMKNDSADYRRVPRADHAVRLFADQIDSLGQPEAAAALRDVAKKMQDKFDACRDRDSDFDFHDDKALWVSTLTRLKPKWLPFFKRRKNA